MLTVMTILVFALGLGLIATGLYYHWYRNELGSDPVLIRSCYLSGAVLVLANLLIPGLS